MTAATPAFVAPPATAPAEAVVLLDSGGSPVGTMEKALVHSAETPLHLAFSCYGFDQGGRMLLTRRSLGKQTWPGVWTNTCCGHPSPGEDLESAIRRRLRAELGLEPSSLRSVLPDFRYRAVAPDGIVENEVCPVYFAELPGDPSPAPDEVMEWRWVEPVDFLRVVDAMPSMLSPWSVLQADQLRAARMLPG